jgi:hypothetical protein
VKFGERGKSSGRHSRTSTVKLVLTVPLTKGPLRVCVDLVKGPNRVYWRGFRGDDPGCPRFDRCSASLTRLIRSLVLMTLIKNLGRQARRVFEYRCSPTVYAPWPFVPTGIDHPSFTSWWQEFHDHIFNEPVHSLCLELMPGFQPISEVTYLSFPFLSHFLLY